MKAKANDFEGVHCGQNRTTCNNAVTVDSRARSLGLLGGKQKILQKAFRLGRQPSFVRQEWEAGAGAGTGAGAGAGATGQGDTPTEDEGLRDELIYLFVLVRETEGQGALPCGLFMHAICNGAQNEVRVPSLA